MPPKSKSKKSLASTSKCRRSRRIAYKIKSMVKGESASSKQPSSTKGKGKQPYRKKPVAKAQPASSKEQSSTTDSGKPTYSEKSVAKRQHESSTKGQSPSTKKSTVKNGRSSGRQKSVSKRKPASSGEGQSTSKKKSTVKKRRIMEMDEINERASQLGHEEPENFSANIAEISRELCPDLEISEEAIVEMNVYLDRAFERLARASAILLIGRNDVLMTEKDIETAIVQVVEGELAKYCIAEGRRAVKKME